MISTIEFVLTGLATSIPSAALVLVHGSERGTVLSVSSRELTDETVGADSPVEVRRVVGKRSDYPTVTRGSTVELDGAMCLVTSAKTDPIGASVSLGLSASMDEYVADYRRSGTPLRQPVRILAVEGDVLEPYGDNLAPTTCRAWFCCVSAADWMEETEPQIGDELRFDETRVRVATVKKTDGSWILTCRARRN